MRGLMFILLVMVLSANSTAQKQEKNRLFFIEPEYMIGRIVPNYVNNFPQSDLQHGLAISIGSMQLDSSNSWSRYYNHPQTGMSLFYSYHGNNDIFGHQLSLMPFIALNVFNQSTKPYYLKLSLGLSYFTTFYDSITNRRNRNVGSSFTWGFQAAAYKTITEKNGFNLKAGLIFSHASNGHTQLPNLGTNSLLLSIATQFYKKEHSNYQLTSNRMLNHQTKNRNYLFGMLQSFGFHEYGDKDGPVGGPKKAVYSTSLYLGKVYNEHFRLSTGLTFRYYESYREQIELRQLNKYLDQPKWSASNLVLFIGGEYYLGHIGMEVELGYNLYKPFYDQYEEDFPLSAQFRGYMQFTGYFKKLFSTRLGLNVYLINTNKIPRHNLFIGPHIKGNAGQADFTEMVIGYQYRLK